MNTAATNSATAADSITKKIFGNDKKAQYRTITVTPQTGVQ